MMSAPATYFTFFPQFTPDPLNDAAWYPGFTDWDLIRKMPESTARHYRPKGKMYDTSSPEYLQNLVEQTANVRGSAVGLMVYHYHFDGRSVLGGFEKNLAESKTAPPFFICWANETWSKRWIGKAGEIIIEQQHKPDEASIHAHALYLSKLFEKPEYLKIEDRPLWVIYNPIAAVNLDRSIEIYRKCFSKLGFEPIVGCCLPHLVPEIALNPFDIVAEFQPRFFFGSRTNDTLVRLAAGLKASSPRIVEIIGGIRDRIGSKSGGRTYRYADYLEAVSDGSMEAALRSLAGNRPVMRGSFFGWNNSPRYGDRNTSVSHEGVTVEQMAILKRLQSDADFPLLINSWNEWSEGAALEPAEEEDALRTAYLDIILDR